MAPCAWTEDENYSHSATVLGSCLPYRGGGEVGQNEGNVGTVSNARHRARLGILPMTLRERGHWAPY